jgi:uncharacterized membrane protein
MTALIVISAVGSGLVGGVWFAFSGFVMQALARLPSAQGAAAMQAINVTAVRPPLMIAMFGTAAVCVATAVVALTGDGEATGWIVAGAALYLLGSVGVTIVANVPLNDALMRVAPEDAGELWSHYLDRWTAWNTVRGVTAVPAAAAFAVALI